MKGKTAIIGDGDSVLAFRAVGMDAYGAYALQHPEKMRVEDTLSPQNRYFCKQITRNP